jgi:hypothetical protein
VPSASLITDVSDKEVSVGFINSSCCSFIFSSALLGSSRRQFWQLQKGHHLPFLYP